jgi:predicted ribosome quality control (RQC) complex YloA/Tae2 family protein
MALDAGMIACIRKELADRLTNCKLEKIHQPEKDQIDLIFRSPEGPLRLALSAAPGNPRLGITKLPKENPATPPFFCTLLRKHLASGVLRSISQPGFERMAAFHFDARDELGFETKRILLCELMGKYSNLILCDGDYKILGILRPIDFTKSEKRQLLPGMRYELPPAQEGKINPLEETGEAFFEKALLAGDRPADKFLLSCYAGISPLVARELSHRASGQVDAPSGPYRTALYAAFSAFVNDVKAERFTPCILRLEGKNAEYSFLPITQYAE